jgi:hypothetical protein
MKNILLHTAALHVPTARAALSVEAKPFVTAADRAWFVGASPWTAVHTSTTHPFNLNSLNSLQMSLVSFAVPYAVQRLFLQKVHERHTPLLNADTNDALFFENLMAAMRVVVNTTASSSSTSSSSGTGSGSSSSASVSEHLLKLRALLWLEECQMQSDIEHYDLHNVQLTVKDHKGQCAVLQLYGCIAH